MTGFRHAEISVEIVKNFSWGSELDGAGMYGGKGVTKADNFDFELDKDKT